MTMFKRDLKKNVKDELMRSDARFDTIQTLVKIAIDVDDKLYERAMKKRYDQPQGRAGISFGPTVEYHAKRDHFKKYSNPDYRGPAPMKLNSTQRRKEKNSRGKQDNKSQKTCYSCGKSDHFARDCRSKNLMISRQINAMLREIPDSQNDIRKQVDTKTNTLETESNDDYYLIENLDQLQKVLDETSSDKALASTQKVNQVLQKTIKSHSSVIDSDEEYD